MALSVKELASLLSVLSEDTTQTQSFESLATSFHHYFTKQDHFKVGSSIVHTAECLNSPKGLDYFGTENKTVDKEECQRWDSLEPHQHNFSVGFMGLSASEHENYCRNPNDDIMPWCFTVNSRVRFQYCNIQECKKGNDCKITKTGSEYRGKQNRTRGGIPCQRWDTNTPHKPDPDIGFPGATLSAQENFCRNPNKFKSAPWCYTVDPNVRWQTCDIPLCFNGKNAQYLVEMSFKIYLELSELVSN
uniref:Plasminogen n=1 Tax=Magallana gigas TaxID=29159 RepID=K1QJ11_MAGGI